MVSGFVLVLLSGEDFSTSRIKEVDTMLNKFKKCVFMFSAPTPASFQHYMDQMEKASIYNKSDYVPASQLIGSMWGFGTIVIFHEDSHEVFRNNGLQSLGGISSTVKNHKPALQEAA